MAIDRTLNKDTSSRIQGIDVLRGVAALTVVFSHYIPFWDKYLSPIPVVVPSRFGYYSVELFFVISGIVIYSTLSKCESTAQFLFLRLSRLYPAYWASLWFVALVTFWVFQKPVWWNGVIANTTMFQEFFGFNNFDNVYWSLTVELAFYLNVAWLFALRWHQRIITVCSIWLVLACVWKLTLSPVSEDERGIVAMLFAFDYAHFFVIGIVLYDSIRNGVSKSTYVMLALALIAASIVSGFEGFAVSAVVIVLASLAISGRLNFMVNPLTLWLGNISFSLYLIHRNLGYSILPELHKQEMGAFLAISTTVVVSLLLATLLTFLIERPALSFLRSKSPWLPKHLAPPREN